MTSIQLLLLLCQCLPGLRLKKGIGKEGSHISRQPPQMHDGKALWKQLTAKVSDKSVPSTGKVEKPHCSILGSVEFQKRRQHPVFTQQALRLSLLSCYKKFLKVSKRVCTSRAQLSVLAAKPDNTERAHSHKRSSDLYMCAKACVCTHNKQENAKNCKDIT